ncbi:DNA polymerase III subunit gamma/tau, partial [bacterium]|nr:DNA polymerase III subunit gamma/tau [bacterium]
MGDMSYLVLARKYRPQTFDEIVGQRHVSRTLSAAIESGRIAHAYLFTGTRGVGKTTAARILAKSLNCEHGPTAKPCNKCRNCVEITKGSSTDVFEIDGASNTGVDDVRELRENVKFLPQASRYKIIIIDEVHMLSTNAFNALLKTLEEPPEHVVFIFATTEVHKIPDTILSRCQQYDFKMIPLREIHDALKAVVKKEKIKLSDDQLVLIARKAEGSMRDAMSYLDQALSFAGEKLTTEELVEVLGIMDRRVLLDLSGAILTGETDKTLDILEGMAAVAWDVKQFYGDLMEHFRNLVIAKLSKRPEKLVNATSDELEALQTQVENVSYETLENLFSIIVQSEEEIVRSAYPRLILEMTLIRLATARPVKALDELAGEIGRLRGLLASGKGSMAPSGGGMGGSGSGRHGTSRPSTPPRGGSSYRASEPGPSPATTSAAPSNGPAPVNGAVS